MSQVSIAKTNGQIHQEAKHAGCQVGQCNTMQIHEGTVAHNARVRMEDAETQDKGNQAQTETA